VKSCPRCSGFSPDTTQSCQHCGTVLDEGVISRAGGPPARTTTVVEPRRSDTLDLRPTPPSPPPPSAPLPPPPSVPDASAAPGKGGRRGHTVYMPPSADSSARAPGTPTTPAGARKVIAILVTYSWKPEGQIFAVREGRNLIGRGAECDIQVPDDPMLSQVNSHITFRQNFVLGDMVSMGGTDLNGSPIEEQFRPIDNHSAIRTGSTHWHFVIVDPDTLSKISSRA
jgi:hypothetical protein